VYFENLQNENCTWFGGFKTFIHILHVYYRIYIEFSLRDLYTMLLKSCRVTLKIATGKGSIFVMVVNKIKFTHVPLDIATWKIFNPLTPNDCYSGRTAPLTTNRCILYIYSTNTGTEYFKHGTRWFKYDRDWVISYLLFAHHSSNSQTGLNRF